MRIRSRLSFALAAVLVAFTLSGCGCGPFGLGLCGPGGGPGGPGGGYGGGPGGGHGGGYGAPGPR